jgi:adenylate cyclase
MASLPAAAAAVTFWPRRPGPVLDWLVGDGRQLPDARALLEQLCVRLLDAGLPLARASFHIRTLHPQLYGVGLYWRRGADQIEAFPAEHGILQTAMFQNSPLRLLFDGARTVRQRLDLDGVEFAFPLFHELREQGLTDYVALPITFSDGKLHGTTWSTDHPGGFEPGYLAQLEDLLPVVGLLLEIHLNRRIAINLLDTYVGHDAGERILQGQITRGSAETVQAAIWYCDLRGFTALSERLGRDALLACLNDYFDCMALPIKHHQGEILKFIGDAILAIFRLHDEPACGRALGAAIDARGAMLDLNRRRRTDGLEALDFGLALHAGEVMYGNIGTADRLDFTVIGPAVNLTTRIERLCRTLGLNLLMSETFAAMCPRPLRSLGRHRLAGVQRPVEIFTLPAAP